MMPLQSIEAPAPSSTADENGEHRQQKPKTLPCKYCSKRFRRVEHVQRHERTHTKEKPFSCGWARCGKTFGRRDLLVRHEKLVHLNEGSNKDGAKQPRKSSSGGGAVAGPSTEPHVDAEMIGMQPREPQPHALYRPEPMQPAAGSSLPADSRLAARAPACNLDLLSDAATHLASGGEVSNMQPAMMQGLQQPPPEMTPVKAYSDGLPYGDRSREQEPAPIPGEYAPQPQPAPYDDYSLFLDDFAPSSHFLPASLEAEQGFGMWPRQGGELGRGGPSKPPSTFPSRFPSLQPDAHGAPDGNSRMQEDSMRAPNWRISAVDHTAIKSRLDEFSSVLPSDFVFPSRHTLNRFLEGYISGFHDHLPFLHLPTLMPIDLSPELLLAISAVGAQYRFETTRGHALWYAAKAVALEQIRRRSSHEVHGLLPTPAAYSPHSTRPSPSSGFRHSFPSVHQDRPMTQDTHREPYSPNTPQSRLETIQALLLLFAVGLWGAKAILHEAMSLQSLLALLIREEGLVAEQSTQQSNDWETWVRLEAATRTKLIAYCFFNLCSIAYNTPPLLLTSEIHLYLPNSSQLWKAESTWQWQDARPAYPPVDIPFQDAFSRLLNRTSQGPPPPVTSLGNYVLIHALIQHIFLLKQTSSPMIRPFGHGGLKLEDVDDITQALRAWTASFEQHRPSREANSAGNEIPGGPVVFNSSALLRLAYIRLYTDLSPTRSLETRDHVLIAGAFSDAPLLARNSDVCRAVLQAIHALSMLVRMGVNYVARTKSLEWSMQHSLCNLECAVLISKWLLTLATIDPAQPPPTPEERNLLETLRRMLDETEFAVPVDPSLGGSQSHHPSRAIDGNATDATKLRQLASAVIRLWAETFKGVHIFEIVRIMAAGLEGYAERIEKPRDRTPLRGIGSTQGLG
ncbi:transcriptional regulator ADR1 [Podospora aff. communis PSN243]|uniref:Transcriptional regulator ADR1 n=1 Tax=Podospora aff. communis PSN243 TaxID=3040156 RepID=A0AAV9G5L7_9PEZI|nr:transcriptional regulator ADR1 [Podospora aff. communis PSN243]